LNNQRSKCNSPVVVALDYATASEAMALVDQLSPNLCRLKIGKQLFTQAGPDFVKALVNKEFDVFLDLKFHDIPNTVASACKAAADLGVWMLNVHASGGQRMLEAARDAVPKKADGPLLIAVSVLTSMNDEDLRGVGVQRSVAEQVAYLAQLAFDANLDGMVCSAEEAPELKSRFANNFCLVTPGIRTKGSSVGDQRRVMTPQKAIEAGSDYLVIGRSVTSAQDPYQALLAINTELGVVV
jgi:orotidine-5'-phosphate decarboxylase